MLYDLFQRASARHPQNTAIVHDARSITYRDLDARVRAASAGLRALGIGPGSLVATALETKIETLVLYYALAKVGARLLSMDSNCTAVEFAQILERFEPGHILCDGRCLEAVRLARQASARAVVVISRGTDPCDIEALTNAPDAGDEAAERAAFAGAFHITFTSGSTGRPKGIVLSQRALCRRITDWIAFAGLTSADAHLCCLTLSHAVGPQYGAFPALSTGGTLHLMDPLRITPLRILRYLQERRIQCFSALPYFYKLMASVDNAKSFDLRALRIAMSVAAPLPLSTAQEFRDKYGVTLWNCYGLSECGVFTVGTGATERIWGAAIGKPLPGVELKLLGAHSDDSEAPGAEGEIAVRAATLADGYFSSDDGPLLRDGWLHTADVARRANDGNLYIVGRQSQFINVGGNKVAPIELEVVIGEVPGVREVAVVGIPDPLTTQKVAAFVVAEPGVTAQRIQQHCRRQLTGFKVPAYIAFRKALPKSSLGKVLKTQLRVETPVEEHGSP
jgi:long-chain acyl-CoA synthetase